MLPGSGHLPVGGFKVVYEYAGRLAARGHQVRVVHVAQPDLEAPLLAALKARARYAQRRLQRSYLPRWFALHPAVEVLWRATPDARGVPDGDAVIATAWQTAEWVARYPAAKGRGFYLIQHYETWSGPRARVDATFRLPLRKLAIARWLQRVVADAVGPDGEGAAYLPNGLDLDAFGLDSPIEGREPRAMMLFHTAAWKGSGDGLRALERVRAELPELRATLFGVPAPPPGLPAWVRYVQTPPPEVLRGLYNESAVFLATSWTEGWGLPGCEALLCGCALAATEVGGHLEYARHGETALLSPPKDPGALARNVLTLLQNPPLRVTLARQGHRYVQRFSWERAVARLEALLSGGELSAQPDS
ncbi:glycosyl transferase group 1 [Truepera radiovictrix DSM 17093]|uniref:Glycosyl transferase group 1 n=1 Tax=Truepera radiovictrix (strain DSM 17093 / CIP 108686 / LMG 22925 / RQ-24) TaxID=649638 RepID=D7CV01_TRURR|nr:glycosyl transferase group 1 [Truepera radiovictrix DSM 17093]